MENRPPNLAPTSLLKTLEDAIHSFENDCGFDPSHDHSSTSLRVDMDAKNSLFWIEEKLKVMKSVSLNETDEPQFEMLIQIKLLIGQLRENIKSQNVLSDDHPTCQHLDSALGVISALIANISITNLMTQLEILKQNAPLDKNQQRVINNLFKSMKKISQQENVPADQKLIDMMQRIVTEYYTIRSTLQESSASPFLFKNTAKDTPLGSALESFINNQMSALGKKSGMTVPAVPHTIAHGETAPLIQPTAPSAKHSFTSTS